MKFFCYYTTFSNKSLPSCSIVNNLLPSYSITVSDRYIWANSVDQRAPEGAIWSRSTLFEPWHDKTNKMSVGPAKTRISLGIRLVWSESSLSAWRNLESLATHWAHSEDPDQTGQMPRLIWVFAGRKVHLPITRMRNRDQYWKSIKEFLV